MEDILQYETLDFEKKSGCKSFYKLWNRVRKRKYKEIDYTMLLKYKFSWLFFAA